MILKRPQRAHIVTNNNNNNNRNNNNNSNSNNNIISINEISYYSFLPELLHKYKSALV